MGKITGPTLRDRRAATRRSLIESQFVLGLDGPLSAEDRAKVAAAEAALEIIADECKANFIRAGYSAAEADVVLCEFLAAHLREMEARAETEGGL